LLQKIGYVYVCSVAIWEILLSVAVVPLGVSKSVSMKTILTSCRKYEASESHGKKGAGSISRRVLDNASEISQEGCKRQPKKIPSSRFAFAELGSNSTALNCSRQTVRTSFKLMLIVGRDTDHEVVTSLLRLRSVSQNKQVLS
jgi:hypothetical protein